MAHSILEVCLMCDVCVCYWYVEINALIKVMYIHDYMAVISSSLMHACIFEVSFR